ncbi:TIGR02391 family protein [Pseudonocardia sp. GCM10023141]|uniref:TIGR02391 family protein n=1 Tax=Pseudonocardia sp. GCM10023141 TaxID=3252653 RepID=UPI00362373D8
MVVHHPPWERDIVLGVAGVLGAPDTGLTGPEIQRLLAAQSATDPGSSIASRHRIAHALLARQTADHASNCIIRFIRDAMAPARYVNTPGLRRLRRDALNEVLACQGLRVLDDGRLSKGARPTTPDGPGRSADITSTERLRTELRRRGTHPDVLSSLPADDTATSPLHTMHAASRSVFTKLRMRAGLTSDGAPLVDAALTPDAAGLPILAINGLTTESERAEQRGLVHLIKGLAGMCGAPTVPDPRRSRAVADDELLELLAMVSMVHRRLDAAKRPLG